MVPPKLARRSTSISNSIGWWLFSRFQGKGRISRIHFKRDLGACLFIENLAVPAKQTDGAVWIYPSGKVIQVSQLVLRLGCNMSFHDFSRDIQECGIWVGTFLEDASEILIGFFEEIEPVTLPSDFANDLDHGGTTEGTIGGVSFHDGEHEQGNLNPESFAEFRLDLERKRDYYNAFVIMPGTFATVTGIPKS